MRRRLVDGGRCVWNGWRNNNEISRIDRPKVSIFTYLHLACMAEVVGGVHCQSRVLELPRRRRHRNSEHEYGELRWNQTLAVTNTRKNVLPWVSPERRRRIWRVEVSPCACTCEWVWRRQSLQRWWTSTRCWDNISDIPCTRLRLSYWRPRRNPTINVAANKRRVNIAGMKNGSQIQKWLANLRPPSFEFRTQRTHDEWTLVLIYFFACNSITYWCAGFKYYLNLRQAICNIMPIINSLATSFNCHGGQSKKHFSVIMSRDSGRPRMTAD